MSISDVVLELAGGELIAVTQDGSVRRLRVQQAPDGSYAIVSGERASVRQGLVEALRTVPSAPEHYAPSP